MTPSQRYAVWEDFLREWKLATLLAMSPPLCIACQSHPAASGVGLCKRCAVQRDAA